MHFLNITINRSYLGSWKFIKKCRICSYFHSSCLNIWTYTWHVWHQKEWPFIILGKKQEWIRYMFCQMFPQISPLMQAKEIYFAFACLKKYPIFSVCDALSNALFPFYPNSFLCLQQSGLHYSFPCS